MRCKYGNDIFYAHQRVYFEVIVDESGEFHSNLEDIAASIYDSDRPYGQYTCAKCNAEYDTLASGND